MMSVSKIFLARTLIAFVVACAPGDDLSSFIAEDPVRYNDKISAGSANNESWADDPVMIVRQLFRGEEPERRTTIELQAENVDRVTVVLTQEGLADDSVYGEKRLMRFEREVRVGFRCQKNRGHENYSSERCS